jgi:hypothetical protein
VGLICFTTPSQAMLDKIAALPPAQRKPALLAMMVKLDTEQKKEAPRCACRCRW